MAKKNLPLFPGEGAPAPHAAKRRPSIEVARTRLGGVIGKHDLPRGLAPGVLVTVALASGRRLPGVVVFASTKEVHVLFDSARLRRVPPEGVTPHQGEVDPELAKIAADARLFGMLVAGQSVRYADDSGGLVPGKIVEKCRWGALVVRDDGAVIAVGFRKIWPSPEGASA